MAEYVTSGMDDSRTVLVRACALCVRMPWHHHSHGETGHVPPGAAVPFCDRCLDDLAALIKARRNALHEGEGVSAELMRGMWPVGAMYRGPLPPSFSLPEWQWRARDDLGPQVWERIA